MDRFIPFAEPASSASFRLPTARTSIVGRQHERARIIDSLRRGERLVTLVGTGGVGKTRLALAVAEELLAVFDYRVGWVSLGELTDPDLLLDTTVRALDIPMQGRDPLDALRSGLGDRPVLLVIDNMEHLAGAATVLGELLEQAPQLSLLVTSRLPLRLIGERELRVTPFPAVSATTAAELPAHPAIRLFIERAQAVDSSFEPQGADFERIAAIVAQLDFLPLAIELAAARVRHFSLEEIQHLLSTSLDLLTGGPRDAPDRHRTIRGTIEWSYRLLDAPEQLLFRGLSVFPGSFTLDSALQLFEKTDLSRSDIIDLVSTLVDQNLLMRLDEPGVARYALLGSIRAYGRTQLVAHGEEDAVHSRFAASVLERVLPPTPETIEDVGWLGMVERSMGDVRAAVNWAIAARDGTTALRIGSALSGWWEARGNPREAARLYTQALPLATDAPDEVRFAALRNYAWLLALSGETAHALALRPEIVALSEAIGDAQTDMNAKKLLGVLAFVEGDLDEGRRFMEEALEIAEASGLNRSSGGLLINLATFAELSKDYEASLAYHRRGLAHLDRERNPGFYTMHLLGMAAVLLAQGHLQESDRIIRDVWPAIAELRMTQVVVGAAATKGELLLETGDPERAARLFGAAEQIIETNGWVLSQVEIVALTELHDKVAAALPDDVLERATATGRAMSIDDLSCDMEYPIAVAPVAPAPSLLTPREIDVARLLVEGKTNPEIAEALFISERTVQSHVANIMAKLGVNSRTAAAARVVRDGLLPA